jgi:hypothetical protein
MNEAVDTVAEEELTSRVWQHAGQLQEDLKKIAWDEIM